MPTKHLFMKSTIKLALNEERRTIINIEQSKDISDTRDWLCADFVQSLGYQSQFAFIECVGTSDNANQYRITPVTPEMMLELKERVDGQIAANAKQKQMLS